MKYYYVCVEQVWKEDTETGEKKLQEYLTQKQFNDEKTAEVGYFNRCAELANSKVHQYAMIQLQNSKFGVFAGYHCEFGEYIEDNSEPKPTSEGNTEEG